jgi:hypothetical protein
MGDLGISGRLGICRPSGLVTMMMGIVKNVCRPSGLVTMMMGIWSTISG